MTGRRARAALAVLVALLLAGCGGLSHDGPVEPGLDLGSGNPPNLGVSPPGPVDGAGQESIVRGFVKAGTASDAAYDNARAFLTAKTSEQWNPDRNLVLLSADNAPAATLLDPATVRISAKAAGTVDADGRYTAAAPGSTVTADFGLTSVGGQWRISELPKGFGRWITSSDVSRLVQPYDLHYVSTSQRALVSDTRWFPVDKLASRLARAQIEPVPAHLEGAAVSAVPSGARLLGDAVSIESGVATVNLISGKLAPGETTRQNLWAQFVSTLTQDSAVSRVELSVGGVPVNLVGLDGSAGTLTEVGFSTPPAPSLARPVVRRGDDVMVFDPSTLGDAEPRQPAVSSSNYPQVLRTFHRLALSADGAELAGVDPGGDGISRWRGVNRYEVPLDATDVGNPSYDRRGFLWMGGCRPQGAHGPPAVGRRPLREPGRPARRRHRRRGEVARRSSGARGSGGAGRRPRRGPVDRPRRLRHAPRPRRGGARRGRPAATAVRPAADRRLADPGEQHRLARQPHPGRARCARRQDGAAGRRLDRR